MEVTNRFKELNLVDKVPEKPMEGVSWHCTGSSDQNNFQEKQMKKAKWFSEEALQKAMKGGERKDREEKEIYTH